jgi:hypothetical protein
MAYASVTYTSASGTTFALTNSNGDPIPYIRKADIKVYVNTVLQTLTTDYTFNTAGTAIVLNTPVSGATVLLQRITDIADPTVVYTAGSTLTAQDLNNADNQLRYGLQEFQDSVNAGGGVPDGDKGDISVANNGTIWTIDAGAVNNNKIASGAAIAGTKISPDFGSQTVTTTGPVVLGDQGDLRFNEATANGTNYVGFQAPSSISSNVLWTLPSTDTSIAGYALVSDAAGTLSWGRAGGASGGGSDQVFYENDQTVTTNYTISTNKNAVTAGPVTINSGVTVTVPTGSTWVIV